MGKEARGREARGGQKERGWERKRGRAEDGRPPDFELAIRACLNSKYRGCIAAAR